MNVTRLIGGIVFLSWAFLLTTVVGLSTVLEPELGVVDGIVAFFAALAGVALLSFGGVLLVPNKYDNVSRAYILGIIFFIVIMAITGIFRGNRTLSLYIIGIFTIPCIFWMLRLHFLRVLRRWKKV